MQIRICLAFFSIFFPSNAKDIIEITLLLVLCRPVQRPVHPIQSTVARALGGPGLRLPCLVCLGSGPLSIYRAPFKL